MSGTPQAFLSYTRLDDQGHGGGGGITALRAALELQVRIVTGDDSFEIFQDVDGIAFGQHWPKRLDQALAACRFLIPVLSPRFFRSEPCRDELRKFLAHEQAAGRDDLILPIYLVEAAVLERPHLTAADELATAIAQRQRWDWRPHAFSPATEPTVQRALRELATAIGRRLDQEVVARPPSVRPPAPTLGFSPVETGAASPPARDPPAIPTPLPRSDPVDVHAPASGGPGPPPAPPPKRRARWLAFVALFSAGAIGVGAYIFTHPSIERSPATVEAQLAAITPPPAVEPAAPLVATRPAPTQPIPPAKPARMQPGQMFTDTLADGSPCPFCPELIVIPAGSFTMGSTPEERKWAVDQGGKEEFYKDEQPAHPVTIASAFALGRTEVTRGQFARFVNDTKRDMSAGCNTWTGSAWKLDAGKGWQNPGFDQDDSHPVVCVSWDDAVAYVGWLKKQTGKDYRLPSEAEWEYAARAGSTTMRFWGDDWKNADACSFANAADLTAKDRFTNWAPTLDCRDGSVYTASVGKYKGNTFGLFDVLGNVWEWNQDCYHDGYNGAPKDGSEWKGADCRP